MADETQSARRAKRVLLVVVLLCIGVSLSLIIFVIEGSRGEKKPDSTRPAVSEEFKPDARAVLASYGKSLTCLTCHRSEYQEWAGSHHALAERPTRADLDRPAFEPARNVLVATNLSQVRLPEQRFE